MPDSIRERALAALKRHYGYTAFRPGQEEVICAAASGRDTVVLMPTGGGKSLCYQIPALILPGCALVVSPLIALMNDQVMALRANGIPAAALHSGRDEYLNRRIVDQAASGQLKLLYVSPERLMADFDTLTSALALSLVAIDEAHCISQWGHDFRPVYTQLVAIKEKLPKVPVMALTATADRLTRLDIGKSLGLVDPVGYTGSFDRPNISLSVMPDPGKRQRLRIIASMIERHSADAGIVYCLSRKKTEEMHLALSDMGYRSVCYHAGMDPAAREQAQKAFVNGDVQVVCATIAFGMGIDKSNIRWVVHNNMPGNIESYYQEIGRAGRDGMPAEALMFYNFQDVIMRRNFVEESGQPELNGEKLDFMQRYAESSVCRRRILLSYFSEETVHDCGNCDNCRNPRSMFDGTVVAQKALSAVIRINSAEAMNNVIDILRGSNRNDLIAKGYNRIKTYGAGADMSSREWHNYLLQMIQLGLFEIAYEENFHLRPTPLGMKVVRGLQTIRLATFADRRDFGSGRREPVRQQTVLSPDEALLLKLKEVRKKVAADEGIAPYMVFSDASLQDMVAQKPLDPDSFLNVSGAGALKTVKYGPAFLTHIRKAVGLKGTLPTGSSERCTLILHRTGKSPEETARIRGFKDSTIYGHLCTLIEQGEPVDFSRIVSDDEYRMVCRWHDTHTEEPFRTLEAAKGIGTWRQRLSLTERDRRNRSKI